MSPSSPHLPRYAGLDGLRAIAVGLVLIYHLFPGLGLPSGLVGVDVFFVVSGFLITSLMLRPTRHPLRHRLLDFWRRRARRLLPALALMLTVCATVAWLIGGDVLVGIGRQLLGASTFSYNWVALAGGSDYFAATEPELFRNVWSLAVEEQFYLLWPLLLPLLLVVLRVRWALVAFAVAAAGASAWWMSVLVSTGSVTRAYFGTDSHAFGLLLGIALAFGIRRMPEQEWMLRPSARAGGVLLGVLGVGAIVAAALKPSEHTGAGFPGTLLLASAGTVLAVFAGVMPGSWFGRAIDVQPLRWIGDRSYGIYLWHWPVLVLVSAASGLGVSAQVAGVPVWAGCTALVLSVAAAAVSFRVVETPLRRLGFRRSLRAVRVRFARGPVSRLAMATSALAAVLALGGTTAAVASAPPMTTSEMAIRAGQEALKKVVPTPAPTTPAAISGTDVTAVGDSVMLASAPALQQQFPGIEVDAKVSRSVWAGPRIIDALEDSGNLREHVVVALGTNGSVDEDVLQKIADTVGRNRDLVLVNAYAPRDWIPGVNRDLQSFAAGRLGVVVADWAGAIAPHEDLLAGDRIHPGDAGGRIFAEVVEKGIRDAEAERAARPRITPEPVQ
ncbi:acyltransferase family protein [Microbacterium arabinogalactanolyticum]|uniref:acyltransferase family protein n=1 Tax=Microbacterium arabinogalactanolyticum TaxID=69365 RepID=UPI002555F1DD|nr:acyltransferase family protein [Microbacterium arabinogalactanolyticum]GLC85373.1 acyltransferase [Microbacterium arabinogalactanolyticum]